MFIVAVANPKGGVGKSTLSTNIAGYFASRGFATMLGDYDRQQSSRSWIQRRPTECRPIRSWDIDGRRIARPPEGTTHVVLDTPAGLGGQRLEQVIQRADAILIPVGASAFDMEATEYFLSVLQQRKVPALERGAVGLIGMRVQPRTLALNHLDEFLKVQPVPCVGHLRDTQNYVQLAAFGLTMFDLPATRVPLDRAQWVRISAWLDRVSRPEPAPISESEAA